MYGFTQLRSVHVSCFERKDLLESYSGRFEGLGGILWSNELGVNSYNTVINLQFIASTVTSTQQRTLFMALKFN